MAEFKAQKLTPLAQAPKAREGAAKPKEETIWNREIELTPAFSSKEKQQFFHLLAVLLESGLSITESFEILEDQTSKRKTKKVIAALSRSLNEGRSLFDAMQEQAKYFTPFEIYSIRMGEAAGRVNLVLADLSQFHEKRQRLRRKLSQAFSYPIVVLLIAGGVLAFMLGAVVPMFQDVFKRFGAELPAITQTILALSDGFRKYGIFLLLLVLLVTLVTLRLRKVERFQALGARLVRRIPVLGKLLFTVQLSRFCYTLSVMLKSRVTLDQALELLHKIVQYQPLRSVLGTVRQDVVGGKMLHEALARHKVFPIVLIQMVRVGERTAKLDVMLENLGKNLEEESEAGVTALTNLLEPLLIVILGLVVGIILVAMYMPMFQLSQTFTA
jgi:type IV pilus assembly protein PilC